MSPHNTANSYFKFLSWLHKYPGSFPKRLVVPAKYLLFNATIHAIL